MLAKVINSSTGRCWSSETYNPCPGVVMGIPASNNYQGGFATGLMTKVQCGYWIALLLHIMAVALKHSAVNSTCLAIHSNKFLEQNYMLLEH